MKLKKKIVERRKYSEKILKMFIFIIKNTEVKQKLRENLNILNVSIKYNNNYLNNYLLFQFQVKLVQYVY